MDRISDPDLMKAMIEKGCQLCSRTPSEGHHIKSRGSWGPDIDVNLLALCRNHHTMIHQYGINKMVDIFPGLEDILFEKGWYRQNIGTGNLQVIKWFNDSVHT